MINDAALPETIRVEVKFTTANTLTISMRELEALRTTAPRELGLLAALFWGGDRRVDGRWIIVDVQEVLGQTSSRRRSISKDELCRAMENQSWLKGITEHLDRTWKLYLRAFHEEALASRETLHAELVRCHTEEKVEERLLSERVLESEHRDALARIIERYGEAIAGHIFQDLFAYLLAHAGYRKVTVNPIGVPDIVLSELTRAEGSRQQILVGALELDEVRRLVRYCQKEGDSELVERLSACMAAMRT